MTLPRPSNTLTCLAFLLLALAGCPESGGDHGSHDHGTQDHEAPAASPRDPEVPAVSDSASTDAVAVTDTKVGGEARDPICGMTIAASGDLTSVYESTRFHFCNASCKEKFDRAPDVAATGLPGKPCVCTIGEMANCDCGHCEGEPERCTCGDPEGEGGEGHDHSGHDHSGHTH